MLNTYFIIFEDTHFILYQHFWQDDGLIDYRSSAVGKKWRSSFVYSLQHYRNGFLNFFNNRLHKICQNTGFTWPVFSGIRTESASLFFFVLIPGNTDQRKPLFWHVLCSDNKKVPSGCFDFRFHFFSFNTKFQYTYCYSP